MTRFLILWLIASSTFVSGQTYTANNSIFLMDNSRFSGRDSAAMVLDQALNLMKKNYYDKDLVGWDSLAGRAYQKLAGARVCSDVYSILNSCFLEMKADHCFIMPPANTALYTNDSTRLQRKPALWEWMGEIKSGFSDYGIAYLSVPWVHTTDPAICSMIADSLQHIIEALDKTGVSKWIVDLRENKGGNCWPMLAGIGPLIQTDTCGYFVLPSSRSAIRYCGGNAMNGKHILCSLQGKAYQTRNTKKYIAVLIGPQTSSSGEIIALAFRKQPNTLLFGHPTAGLTTANATYDLLDKSMLVLSVYGEADRSGTICEGKILPDEWVTEKPSFPTDDPVKSSAIRWLQLF
jgi:carboxyl-terminal processing protease